MMEYRTTFQPLDRLLEIGCGTGDEALELAKRGCEVVAIDPSEEMLNLARRKADRQPYGTRLRFIKGYARDLGKLMPEIGDAHFDGAYSSFALSYEVDLEPVVDGLTRLVRPGGSLVVALMNRICAIEYLAASAALRPAVAGRRLAARIPHKVGGMTTEVFSRTVFEVTRLLKNSFELLDFRAVPAVLPPPYLNRIMRRLPSLTAILEYVDPKIAKFPLIRALGDHTLFKFRRRP